jgi:hypothetical protein
LLMILVILSLNWMAPSPSLPALSPTTKPIALR